MEPRIRAKEGLAFDDVLLVPRHSTVHPRQVDVASRLTRDIPLGIPFVSAAMDTVTEADMAIAMARHGGIGVVHKSMPIDRQVAEVDRVKRSESGMILDPITLPADRPIREALRALEVIVKRRPHVVAHGPPPPGGPMGPGGHGGPGGIVVLVRRRHIGGVIASVRRIAAHRWGGDDGVGDVPIVDGVVDTRQRDGLVHVRGCAEPLPFATNRSMKPSPS